MKNEHNIDQISRKLQTDIDRIYHKLNSAEARLETTVNKIQNQLEINFQKAETKQNNIANDISKVNSGIEMLNSQSLHTEQRYNRTLGMLVNHLQEIRHEHADKKEHLKNLTSLVTGLQPNKSEWTQSDAPMLIPKQHIQIIKAEISIEAQKIATKLSNMYNDMWRNIKDLEIVFKIALNESGNKTVKLHNELREMLFQDKTDSENFLDVVLRSVMSSVQTELSNLKMQFETEIQRLITIHQIYGDSCHNVKKFIENGTLVLVLEKMYVELTNRTEKLTKHVTEVGELVKKSNHNIITLGKDSSQHYKMLDSSINDVSEKADEISQELQIQGQDIDESLLKHQKLIKELKVLLTTNMECSKPLPNETMKNNLNALEANYSNGIIKIVTDHVNKTEDKEDERLSKSMGIPLTKLNQSISTSDLVAVIGESKNNKHEPPSTIALAASEEKDRDDEDDFEAQEEFGEDDLKTVDTTQLLLSYIKYLRGHLSAQEFLTEAVPGTKYESLRDMARQLKRTGSVPKEMIQNILDMALDQTDKDSIGLDKEIGNIIRKLSQHNKYETFNEEENYDEALDTPQRE
ncbi:putative leucine-rich repeat-containing protein DDB_G0290503 isoform X2 [Halyomorpha halys]|nr:uncharacterized protein LOC106687734 isoform X2 [Halyomorpha halys]